MWRYHFGELGVSRTHLIEQLSLWPHSLLVTWWPANLKNGVLRDRIYNLIIAFTSRKDLAASMSGVSLLSLLLLVWAL